ncbi:MULTISPECIES: DMT family transporter [unclassified Ruegeria]|uniref:DMT family transporter n=1 Tax=unclassified Ruegeria TaxID=2625375 RepID=UPI001487ED88|nr:MULTISPECIES: DMT family transporter [unclassified Ruegeria]NOD49087.1 EamA family transporter [Ruegeria sp. HKCCD5849]NOD51651.1 EamA family transporter [Ruegeria sp. HKCCD5851]NOD68637.1 EamA family transporter [Ruegeria sp. HKCCD7303]NOE34913.1 EamA family transporter [Ruegeria sp. HKCCD7318]
MTPNTKGALLMMGSMAAFTLNDTLVKVALQELPLFQLVALRGALAVMLVYLLARSLGALHLNFSRHDKWLVALRSLTELAATFFFLTALKNMPLANVTAILQALPLTVTLGAALVFSEQVGWRRTLAIVVGFIGMVLIVRPGPDGFSVYSVYALIAVALITVRDLVTRRMSADVPSMVVTLATSGSIAVVAAIASVFEGWAPVSAAAGSLVAVAAVFVLMGYLLSVMVMRQGDVGFVAPFRYSSLLWALGLGWVVFDEWPDAVTMLGAALIVGAGLFTLFRERVRQGAA